MSERFLPTNLAHGINTMYIAAFRVSLRTPNIQPRLHVVSVSTASRRNVSIVDSYERETSQVASISANPQVALSVRAHQLAYGIEDHAW
jgi:hypothetical protein